MTVHATDPYPTAQHPLKRKKRRHRGRYSVFRIFLLVLAAALLLGAAGKLIYSGMQSIGQLLDGMFSIDSGAEDPQPPVLATDPAPTIPKDTTPPVLSGVRALSVYQGDTISYLRGVSAADDTDPSPVVTIDSSAVDLSSPGTYQVHYIVSDASGNKAQASAEVTVLPKKEDFVDMDTIYEAVDEKLSQILRQDATVKQQIHDIYVWARLNLHYGGHSDRTDWRQTAYVMLTGGSGDCYGYWAVTKLMFERLGIPNIDVRKVKNSSEDSDHFWSLVSYDGEQSWYHFDATPRYGDGDNFCLVTDSFLDAYSEANKGSHNRDKSLYPATP